MRGEFNSERLYSVRHTAAPSPPHRTGTHNNHARGRGVRFCANVVIRRARAGLLLRRCDWIHSEHVKRKTTRVARLRCTRVHGACCCENNTTWFNHVRTIIRAIESFSVFKTLISPRFFFCRNDFSLFIIHVIFNASSRGNPCAWRGFGERHHFPLKKFSISEILFSRPIVQEIRSVQSLEWRSSGGMFLYALSSYRNFDVQNDQVRTYKLKNNKLQKYSTILFGTEVVVK